MSCRTAISTILLLGAYWAAAASAQTAPIAQPRPTEAQMREFERLGRLSKVWADEVRERRGLRTANCSIAFAMVEKSSCGFGVDGIYLSLVKKGRAPGTPEATLITFGRDQQGRRGANPVGDGAWIKPEDLFEIEAGGRVYVQLCVLGFGGSRLVECGFIGDLRNVERRLSFPRARYGAAGFDETVGQAFADGSIRIRQNGKPIDLKPLVGAARDFARQDFEAVAAAAAPPPPPSISFGPVSEAEQRENERLLDIAKRWSGAVRQKYGLTDADCSFGNKPPPVFCGFRDDGLSLSIGRDVPDPTQVKADLTFGHLWQQRDGKAVILEGAWFKPGDLVELDLGTAVYAYVCRPHIPEFPQLVQCGQARDFSELAGRASHPRARYRLADPPAEAAVGRALLEGKASLRHNGRPRSLAALSGAARDFARQDFAQLVESR